MQNTKSFQTPLVIFLGIIIAFVLCSIGVAINSKTPEALGSVQVSGEYQSTSTDPTFLSTSGKRLSPSDLTSCTLGSIIVGVAGTGIITVYDATTTATTTYVINGARTNVGTTTLARVNTATQGTYTYDSIAKYGLVVDTSVQTIGSSTITYRCN